MQHFNYMPIPMPYSFDSHLNETFSSQSKLPKKITGLSDSFPMNLINKDRVKFNGDRVKINYDFSPNLVFPSPRHQMSVPKVRNVPIEMQPFEFDDGDAQPMILTPPSVKPLLISAPQKIDFNEVKIPDNINKEPAKTPAIMKEEHIQDYDDVPPLESVDKNNENAIKLYTDLGFSELYNTLTLYFM